MLGSRPVWRSRISRQRKLRWFCGSGILFGALLPHVPGAMSGAPSAASPQDNAPISAGFVMELSATEADVLQVVKSVAEDSIVHGTYVYENEKTLRGAVSAGNSAFFRRWQGPGHVFYKILAGAVAPRHFKNSSDVGTITVRYVVQGVNQERARVRIDAVFVEDGGHKTHGSDGTVESSEFREIQERLQQVQLSEQQAAEAQKKRQDEEVERGGLLRQREEEATRLAATESSIRELEQRIHDLRHDLEVRIRNEGTELKSAPFHGAAKMESLGAGAEAVVLIITPYWYGVETSEGHRGWVRHDQVEPLP
jgi:hypothetical protein